MRKLLSIIFFFLAFKVHADNISFTPISFSTINQSIIPATDSTYTLGECSTPLAWLATYSDSYNSCGDLVLDTATGTITMKSGATTLGTITANKLEFGAVGTLKASGTIVLDANNSGNINLDASSGATLFQDDGVTGMIVSTSGANGRILKATHDGADDSYNMIGGGGASSVTRGGSVYVYGNEEATYGGDIRLITGDSAGADFFVSSNTSSYIDSVTATTLDSDGYVGFADSGTTYIAFTSGTANMLTDMIFKTNTADGSDNKKISFSGGGDAISTRGAFFSLQGNEYATNSGDAIISAGDNAGAEIQLFAGATEALVIEEDASTNITSGVKFNVTDVNTATYDLLVTDYFLSVSYTSTGAVTSLTLPTAQCNDSTDNGRTIIIKDTGGNANTNNITIDTEGSENIDGSATLVLSFDYNSVTLVCYFSNWHIQ